MSKPNKKDKKKDQDSALEKQYEVQKRQLLDCQFSIKKLEQRVQDLTQENVQLKQTINESGQVYNDTVEELTIKNIANEKRLMGLSNDKTRLQIDNEQKENRIKILEKNLFDQQQSHQKDVEESKKNYHFELAKYQSQLSEYKLYMNERDEMDQDRQQLREKIQIERANKLRQIADKERQKVQATDKIKDEMNLKIKEMEKNLVSLKRQQLQTTTRLTMLQNHQLTSQLEYQSKQTQKLIFKNEELEKSVVSLKQQLDIHKEVEDELAKRSHFSKGVIRKLNLRITELEGEVERLKNDLCLPQNVQRNQSKQRQVDQSLTQKLSVNQSGNDFSIQTNKKIITSLEQELQKSQKKYIELLGLYENSKKDKQELQNKLAMIDKRANQIYKVLYRYYNEVLLKNKDTDQIFSEGEEREDFKKTSAPYDFNLNHLRDSPVEEWKSQDIIVTVQILLNIVQPFMIRSNLLVPSVRKNIILSDAPTQRKSESYLKSLPKLDTTERTQAFQRSKKPEQIPVNIASKIVSSNLRQWGQTVKINKMSISRKYKLSQSYRN